MIRPKIGQQPHSQVRSKHCFLGAKNASKRRSKPTLESVDQEYSWLNFRKTHGGYLVSNQWRIRIASHDTVVEVDTSVSKIKSNAACSNTSRWAQACIQGRRSGH